MEISFCAKEFSFLQIAPLWGLIFNNNISLKTIENVLKENKIDYKDINYSCALISLQEARMIYDDYLANHTKNINNLRNKYDYSYTWIDLTDIDTPQLEGFILLGKVSTCSARTVVQTSKCNKIMDIIGNFFILDEKNNILDSYIADKMQLFADPDYMIQLLFELDKVKSAKDVSPDFTKWKF